MEYYSVTMQCCFSYSLKQYCYNDIHILLTPMDHLEDSLDMHSYNFFVHFLTLIPRSIILVYLLLQ